MLRRSAPDHGAGKRHAVAHADHGNGPAALLALVWLLAAGFMRAPRRLTSYIYRTEVTDQAGAERLSAELSGLAGVAEAAVIVEDGLAYLKVDKRVFDETRLPGAVAEPVSR